MPRKFKITVNGTPYEVEVEEIARTPDITDLATPPRPAPPPVSSPASSTVRSDAGTPPPARVESAGDGDTVSPMAGVVASITVKAGQAVAEGDQVCVIEAMKMKTIVAAHRAGTISAIKVKTGDAVQGGQPLLTIA